jgi:hypothetical protein
MKKEKLVTFRLTLNEYQEYLSKFANAKTKKGKKYTTSDFVRDAIFDKEAPKNMKIVRIKQPSKCQKQRLVMLISTVQNIESIAKSLVFQHQKNQKFQVNEYLLKIDEINNFLKGELS